MSLSASSAQTILLPGMIVRFPEVMEDGSEDFREFLIGRIEQIDHSAAVATIRAHVHRIGEATTATYERSLAHITRCRILPDSPCTLLSAPHLGQGRVLISCDEDRPENRALDYYIQIGGGVRRVSEADLAVPAHRQDPDPIVQALRYELHNPAWHQPRNQVVMYHHELRSVTFGIEDLVGSRVFLLAHQADVITRILTSPDCRFMLADEVGLGKTIEACVVMKALRRREPHLRTLIVAPASLTHQWHNELSRKFWLDIPLFESSSSLRPDGPGAIVSSEWLATDATCWGQIRQQRWGLLIIDEAHHLHKNPLLYERVCALSMETERVLVLTATPIQRRRTEYLALLRLLDPQRYDRESEASFAQLVDAQEQLRQTVALARPLLDPRSFEAEEFCEEIEPLTQQLPDDALLVQLLETLEQQTEDQEAALATATSVIAHIGENYRIESRIIRNRRASLPISLPQREQDRSYSYSASDVEGALLEQLTDYLGAYLNKHQTPLAAEYSRAMLHAAASSPHALLAMLQHRTKALRSEERCHGDVALAPAAPRAEQARLLRLIEAAPADPAERDTLEALIRQTEYFKEAVEQALGGLRLAALNRPANDRLVQCIRAVHAVADQGSGSRKVLVFSAWPQTIAALRPHLTRMLGRGATAYFTADQTDDELEEAADRFQSNPECCVLVCDELGGEGRNFQIAEAIIHIDLPWTPAQIEQRIGRVDRLGRTGAVRSIPLFARDTLEHDLFRIWDSALQLFSHPMSGMEIALESTQDELLEALTRSLRTGLAELLEPMRGRAAQLREAVEQERYFEEGAINAHQREQFERVSQNYHDGKAIIGAVQGWSQIAGLRGFQPEGDLYTYDASQFRQKAMEKARFVPPNMEEAARRAGRRRTTRIEGTFSRALAVQREDLVFFAPGDPWTDAVIANALEGDRGRCCAIGFVPEQEAAEPFFELLFSFQIDPRPLYEAGLDPVYLLHAQSYLATPFKHLLVGVDGTRIKPSDARAKLVKKPFDKHKQTHLGERGRRTAGFSALDLFRERYPADMWRELLGTVLDAAQRSLDEDLLDYSVELSEEARLLFAQRAVGWEAGLRWRRAHSTGIAETERALDTYQRATQALISGVSTPVRRLESICFWQPLGEAR